MCRHLLYAVLGLCFGGVAATATDRYGQWSLDWLRSDVVTLSYTQSALLNGNKTAELGFICIEKNGSRDVGATLLPFEGTYENAQDEVLVLFQKGPHNVSADLSQKWKNAYHYLFLESQDEIGRLVGYLKTKEANGEKFVYLSFSGDFFGRSEIPNLIAVDLSGFSNGFAALQTACAAPR